LEARHEHNYRYDKYLQDFFSLTGAKKQTQFKPNKANTNPIQSQFKPKQSQFKPNQSQFVERPKLMQAQCIQGIKKKNATLEMKLAAKSRIVRIAAIVTKVVSISRETLNRITPVDKSRTDSVLDRKLVIPSRRDL
jgi:hypothetical protein